ncbi:MFS transporter [Oceanimonas sp. MB9]|uniref:MFS transporter n=1 Tax=Oceanimonas sp. MB9 TaxID=2588453 RepID=UPI0013F6042A|nr:MFS transporter [Oceanimonas sp. MB9]NHI01354.1 putative MFS-type transporter YcaD [Oceanimonas sp. MB9]
MIKRLVISLSSLIFSVFLLMGGNTFVMTLLGVNLGLKQVEPTLIGSIMVCYSVGFMLGSLYGPGVIKRVGHIRAFAVFSAVLASSTLIFPLTDSIIVWALLRALSGIAVAGSFVVIESWFSAVASSDNRATLFFAYQICAYLAATAGQLLIGFTDPAAFVPFTIGAILLTAALVPLSLTRMDAPTVEHSERISLRSIVRSAPVGLVAALCSGVLISSFYSMAPVYAIQVGLPVDQLSWFMAASIFTFILFAWPLGRLCDRLNRGTIMLAINLVIALSAAGVIVGGGYHIGILIGFSALYMGMVASIYPVAVAITNDRMEAHHIVAASTTLLLSYGLGSSLGPLFSSGMMTWLGPQGLYLGCGGVALLLSGYTLWWQWRTPAVPVAEQAAYIATPADTPGVITELDPRNDEFVDVPMEEVFPDLEEEAVAQAQASQMELELSEPAPAAEDDLEAQPRP